MVASIIMFLAAAAGSGAAVLPNLSGRETRAQAVELAVALHKKMDADADGYVTPTEIAQLVTKSMNGLAMPGTDANHPLPPLSAAFFAAADSDKDGRISLDEAIAAAKRDFDLQDTNHDGVVTPEERMAFLQKIIADGKTPEGVSLLPPNHDHGRK